MSRVAASARIFIRESKDGHDIVCRIPHEMTEESYLTQITIRRNDEIQAQLLLGRNVSRNPVAGTCLGTLETGDTVSVDWEDIAGRTGEVSRTFDGKTD